MRIVAGKFKGRSLKAPRASTTRPTQSVVREALFNICQDRIEGASFLDLFAGSGAIGLEAISRGAVRSVLVEQNRDAFACIQENIQTLGVSNAVALRLDAGRAIALLAKQGALFNLIYLDPPYDTLSQDLLDQAALLLAPHGSLFIEERHDPKQKKEPYQISSLILKSSRRFGIAVLNEYAYTARD